MAPANRLISVNYDTRYNPAFLGLGNLFSGSSDKKDPSSKDDDSVKDGASTKKDEGIANDQRNGENQED